MIIDNKFCSKFRFSNLPIDLIISSLEKLKSNILDLLQKELRRILSIASRGIDVKYITHVFNYDCIVPISGGKDSCFQLHILVKVYKLTPLAVTFSHNWWTKTGKYNLEILR